MRGIQTSEFLYLYNPWSDGKRKFATATTGTATYRQMVKRAANEPDVAKRLELFDHRVVEELYHVGKDPNCLRNEIDNPKLHEKLLELRSQLAARLAAMEDPIAPLLNAVDNTALREEFMAKEDERAATARKQRRPKNQSNLLTVVPPTAIQRGKTAEILIQHKLPPRLGKQKLHVTLWAAPYRDNNKSTRVERKVIVIEGKGKATVAFDIPADFAARAFQFAAFVGPEFGSHLQHLRTKFVPVKD